MSANLHGGAGGGLLFAGWGGACVGTNPAATVALTADLAYTATCELSPGIRLSETGSGGQAAGPRQGT